jgi:Uma2 family endonuclease
MQEIRDQLIGYQLAHPDVIHTVASGADCKVLLHEDQSERHPDISAYLDSPPDLKDVWSVWVPAIVVEVISECSVKRDYEEKPPEYLDFGISEYWIADGIKRQMTVLERWRGKWRPTVMKGDQKFTTRLLPKFSLNLKKVFRSK